MQADARVTGHVERVLALRTFPGFARLAPEHLVALAEYTRERLFRQGSVLAMPGRPASSVYFIRRGAVRVTREGTPTRAYGAGAVVGGLAALTQDPVGQQIIAMEDTEVFEVLMDDMEEVFEDNFPILVTVMRGLARGVLETRLGIPGNAGFSSEVNDERGRARSLGLVERILFTRHLIAYGKARVEAIAELAREMEERALLAGTVLWEEDDSAPFQYLIHSGIVDCMTSKGHQFSFGANSVIGGIDSMSDTPRWYRAVARTDMVVLRSDVTQLIDVIEDHPDMGVDMLRVLARILLGLQAAGDGAPRSRWATSDAP